MLAISKAPPGRGVQHTTTQWVGGGVNPSELAVIFGGAVVAGLGGLLIGTRLSWLHIDSGLAQRLAMLLTLLWAVVVGGLAILQHLALHSHAYDLGIFDQVVWNSAQGRLFENSVMADSPSFLGHHFSPILLALVPLYWVYPDPVALLAVQALLLALAGLPLFWLARYLLHSPGIALAVLLAYLLHPATAFVALFDFHEIALAVPLLTMALYLLLRQRYIPFALCVALALLAKEEMGLVAAAMGAFIALAQRRWRAGLGLGAAGLLWTLLMVRYVVPSFHPSGEYFFNARYANLGPTPLAAIRHALLDPGFALGQMLMPEKQTYLQQLYAPVAALPLLGWPVLGMAVPTFLYLLLSGQFAGDSMRSQYSAPLLPFLLGASALGLHWLRERSKARWRTLAPGLAAFVVSAAALGAYLYGPLPLARHFTPERYQAAPRLAAARQMIAQIPPQANVIAQSDLVPQLSQRRTVQLFGLADPALRPDYYLFDTDSKASRWPLSYEDRPYLEALAQVRADAEYRVVAEREGFLLLRHETPDLGQRLGATFGDQIQLVGYRVAQDQAPAGGALTLTLYWQAERKPDADYTVFMHLVDQDGKRWGQHDGYPTGNYLLTSAWEPGRLLRGEYAVPIAREAPPGEYHLLVGLYNLATMRRLPVGATPASDSINLRPVSVIAASN